MIQERGITVIIPCFNAEHYIVEAVESIYAQHLSCPFEVIVVDDGSNSDETQTALNKLEERGYPSLKIKYLNDNSGSPSKPRNVGIGLAQHHYVISIDGDDFLRTPEKSKKSFLEKARCLLETDEDIMGVYCHAEYAGKKSGIWPRMPWDLRKSLIHACTGCFTMYRRDDMLAMADTRIGNQQGQVYNESLRYSDDWECLIGMQNLYFMRGKIPNLHRIDDLPAPYRYRIHDHGRNVSARPQDKVNMFNEFYRNFPDIYNAFYPDIENAVSKGAYLYEQQQKTNIGKYFEIAVGVAGCYLNRLRQCAGLTPS